jgi:hypothetical protein
MLRAGDRNPYLCRTPLQWLERLLLRLEDVRSGQTFILRRSAGFAYSFVALLRAEPRNCDTLLLPVAVQRLLAIAAGQKKAGDKDDDDDRHHHHHHHTRRFVVSLSLSLSRLTFFF